MTDRDCEAESVAMDRLHRASDVKIAAQKKRMQDGFNRDNRAADQQLLNEMRGNKASIDVNQALHDFECDAEPPQ